MKKCFKLLSLLLLTTSLVGCTGNSKNSSSISTVEVSNEAPKEVVEVKTQEGAKTYSSLVSLIEDVKSSVCDVTTTLSQLQGTSAGSGVVIGQSEDGYYIITNHHVIDNGITFKVTMYPNEDSKGVTYDASLIGSSPMNDIAVLKVKTSDTFNVATFIEDSDSVKVGTEVVAIGNPLGIYGGTVTKGIVSAIAREVYISDVGTMKLIQTDAAINSGNSGGALFNENGLLVGIVNSGYSSYEGLNFAIPANTARSTMESIINTCNKDNQGNYGYFVGENNNGLTFGSVQCYEDATLKENIQVAYIKGVDNGSDGYAAGLNSYTGYAILKVNDENVDSLQTAQKLITEAKAGESVTLSLKKINSRMAFPMSVYYLDGEVKTITMNLTQFTYTLPNN